MNSTDHPKKSNKLAWPGRKAAQRRVMIIALVLLPLTWIVTALLIGSWNLLGDRNEEAWRHLREAAFVFACTVCIVFLVSLLPSLQRFSNWIFSWRVIRRCLIALAWMVTIIALFYGEENWRGSHRWNKYRDALIAQGDQLDFRAFIPKPVPDAENVAATPEIKSWFIRYTNAPPPGFSNSWTVDNFGQANAMMGSSASDTPRHLTDLVGWQRAFAAVQAGNTNSGQIFKSDNFDFNSGVGAQAARSILEALKPIDARLEELRAATARRETIFPVVYDLDNPWGILLPHLVNLKSVCLRLDLRACAELAISQSDRALDDVKLTLRLSDSLKSEPFLVSYLVRLSTFHLAMHSVWEGLAEHRWSDAQLKELQGLLEHYDFIADMKPPLGGERAAGILTADLLEQGKFPLNELTDDPNPSRGSAANAFGKIMPHGWYQMEKLNYCRLYSLQLEGGFDVGAKRVFPEKIASNMKALNRAFAGRNRITTILTRHQLLAAVMLPALGDVPKKGAIGQVTADEAALACALERYRLAHEQFPDKLDGLIPDFISALPHDVISGGAYKYQRSGDSFKLYSVGWNETDDGGKVVMKGSQLDPTAGDWVWQYPAK
jgi:hypothetical protein